MIKDPIKIVQYCQDREIPFMIITAQDACAISALAGYNSACALVKVEPELMAYLQSSFREFVNWQHTNPKQVDFPKLPADSLDSSNLTEIGLRKTHIILTKGSYKDKKGTIVQGLKAFGKTWAPKDDLYSGEITAAPRIPGIKCDLVAFCSEREKGCCVDGMKVVCAEVPEEFQLEDDTHLCDYCHVNNKAPGSLFCNACCTTQIT